MRTSVCIAQSTGLTLMHILIYLYKHSQSESFFIYIYIYIYIYNQFLCHCQNVTQRQFLADFRRSEL